MPPTPILPNPTPEIPGQALRLPPPPVPEASLRLLYEAACGNSGGCLAARYFLFWLAGHPDPTREHTAGGLELRRLDHRHKAAALEVMTWWAGPIESDLPLHEVLRGLRLRFGPDERRD